MPICIRRLLQLLALGCLIFTLSMPRGEADSTWVYAVQLSASLQE